MLRYTMVRLFFVTFLIASAAISSALAGNLQNKLAEAVKKEDSEAFRDLVCKGADPNKPDSRGKQPLSYARHKPYWTHLLKLIKEKGLCKEDLCGHRPSVMRSEFEEIDKEMGGDIDRDKMRSDADPRLMAACDACSDGRFACVENMLAKGVEANAACPDYGTLLSHAVDFGHHDLVLFLLNKGADPNFVPEYSDSPIYAAIKPLEKPDGDIPPSTCLRILKLLLSRGADPELRKPSRMPLLVYAVEIGNIDAVRLIIQYGANPNGPKDYWDTPLMKAAEKGYLKIALLLINKGARVNARSISDETALDVARRKGQLEMVRALQDLGAE